MRDLKTGLRGQAEVRGSMRAPISASDPFPEEGRVLAHRTASADPGRTISVAEFQRVVTAAFQGMISIISANPEQALGSDVDWQDPAARDETVEELRRAMEDQTRSHYLGRGFTIAGVGQPSACSKEAPVLASTAERGGRGVAFLPGVRMREYHVEEGARLDPTPRRTRRALAGPKTCELSLGPETGAEREITETYTELGRAWRASGR